MQTQRTHRCNELDRRAVGANVRLAGWVAGRRNLGRMLFLDLKDQTGVTQLCVHDRGLIAAAMRLPKDAFVAVAGRVRLRGERNRNPALATGEIEVEATALEFPEGAPPANVDAATGSESADADRYARFRNGPGHETVLTWARLAAAVRDYLAGRSFVELPVSFPAPAQAGAASPDGAQLDGWLLCAQRHHQFALAGFDRFFELRGGAPDAQSRGALTLPLRIHLGISFPTQEEVFALCQDLLRHLTELNLLPRAVATNTPRLTHAEALRLYDTRRPDLRAPAEVYELPEPLRRAGLEPPPGEQGRILMLRGNAGAGDEVYAEAAVRAGLLGLASPGWLAVEPDGVFRGTLAGNGSARLRDELVAAVAAKPGDALFCLSTPTHLESTALTEFRRWLGARLQLPNEAGQCCWVTDFPLYEPGDAPDQLAAGPATLCRPTTDDDAPPASRTAAHFQLVCDGLALGTGALFNHHADSLERVLAPVRRREQLSGVRDLSALLRLGPPPVACVSLDLGTLYATHVGEAVETADWPPMLLMRDDAPVAPDSTVTATASPVLDLLNHGRRVPAAEVETRVRLLLARDQAEVMANLLLASSGDLTDATRQPEDKLRLLRPLLPAHSMKYEHAVRLLEFLPRKKAGVLGKPLEQIFQYVWSILGSEDVRAMLDDPWACAGIEQFVARGIITDHKQLLHFRHATILNLHLLLALAGDADSLAALPPERRPATSEAGADAPRESVAAAATLFRQILARRANDFSTLLDTLAHAWRVEGWLAGESEELLWQAARDGCVTPTFFRIYKRLYPDGRRIELFRAAVRSVTTLVLPNTPLDRAEVARRVREACAAVGLGDALASADEGGEQLGDESLYVIFRPLNLDYARMRQLLEQVEERAEDLPRLGLRFGGAHWDAAKRCYVFQAADAARPTALHVYPSKNRASFFAKAAAGICTADDLGLFNRRDHFHLNLVDGVTHTVVGNVQAYVLDDRGRRVMLLRALNPSAAYLNPENVSGVVRGVLLAAVEAAAGSEVDEVHLTQSLGVWNVESSRPEVRGLLEALCASLPVVRLQAPFPIFTFGGRRICVEQTFRLWDRERGLAAPEPVQPAG